MKIAFLGDSITFGYALDDKKNRFATLICEKLGAEEENYGITGTLVAKAGLNKNDDKAYVDRIELVKDADVAVVFGGTNDYFWSDRPIFPTDNEKTNEYFSVAVDYICDKLTKIRNPKKTLIVTPYPHNGIGNFAGGAEWNTSSRHNTDTINYNGHKLEDYVGVIEKTAAKYGLPTLNLHKVKGFDWEKHTIDGCHPNPEGHKWLANVIGKEIEKMI